MAGAKGPGLPEFTTCCPHDLVFCLAAPDEHGAKILVIVVLILAVLGLLTSCAGGAIGSSGPMQLQQAPQGTKDAPPSAPSGRNPLATVSGGLNLVEWVVFLFFLRALALGLREDGLARGVVALLIGWGVGALASGLLCCVGVGVAVGSVLTAAGDRNAVQSLLPSLGIAGLAVVILIGVVWFGLYLWYLVVLFMVRGAVANQVASGK